MISKPIAPGISLIPLGFVNAFLIDADELTLIDTGVPQSAAKILQALAELGKKPGDLRHILITHLHGDHTGGLAEIKQAAPAAQVYMHPLDAADYRQGVTMRKVEPAPGLLNSLLVRLFSARPTTPVVPVPVDRPLQDGQVFDFAGGLRAIYAPGHTAGHTVFLSPSQGGVLFLGDSCSHMRSLGWSFLYENFAQGHSTLRALSGLKFETACFSHGSPILSGANREFRAKFGV